MFNLLDLSLCEQGRPGTDRPQGTHGLGPVKEHGVLFQCKPENWTDQRKPAPTMTYWVIGYVTEQNTKCYPVPFVVHYLELWIKVVRLYGDQGTSEDTVFQCESQMAHYSLYSALFSALVNVLRRVGCHLRDNQVNYVCACLTQWERHCT